MGEIAQTNGEQLKALESMGNFEIEPYWESLSQASGLTKLNIDNNWKRQVSAFIQNLPALMAADTLAQTYVVHFPNGLPHVLTSLRQGGHGTMVSKNGKFAGTASLYSTASQAAVLGAFSIMSIASGQYYLNEINQELTKIKMGIDKILEFLYGDKKAELMAEVSFIKYAHQNFGSIMESEAQRIATISSLQSAKKVAMKDIEFYMSDLTSTVNEKGTNDISTLTKKAFQIKDSLELSMQLYGMCSVLEIYFSQNHDSGYLSYIENEMTFYIDKCEKHMLSTFSILGKRITDHKGKPWEKIDNSTYENSVNKLVDSLNSGEESKLRKIFRTTLQAETRPSQYYITKDGNLYLKTS